MSKIINWQPIPDEVDSTAPFDGKEVLLYANCEDAALVWVGFWKGTVGAGDNAGKTGWWVRKSCSVDHQLSRSEMPAHWAVLNRPV